MYTQGMVRRPRDVDGIRCEIKCTKPNRREVCTAKADFAFDSALDYKRRLLKEGRWEGGGETGGREGEKERGSERREGGRREGRGGARRGCSVGRAAQPATGGAYQHSDSVSFAAPLAPAGRAPSV